MASTARPRAGASREGHGRWSWDPRFGARKGLAGTPEVGSVGAAAGADCPHGAGTVAMQSKLPAPRESHPTTFEGPRRQIVTKCESQGGGVGAVPGERAHVWGRRWHPAKGRSRRRPGPVPAATLRPFCRPRHRGPRDNDCGFQNQEFTLRADPGAEPPGTFRGCLCPQAGAGVSHRLEESGGGGAWAGPAGSPVTEQSSDRRAGVREQSAELRSEAARPSGGRLHRAGAAH